MKHRAPSRSPAVSNSGFSDFDAPSESFPRSAPLRNPPKIVHVDVNDIGGEKPAKKRSLQWSGLFNIFLMIGICVVGGALYAKVKEANENGKEANALKLELERMKKSQHLQTLPKGICECGDERRKLDENKRKIEQLGAEIDGLKKERYQNEQKISNLEIEVDQRVADLSLKERENEELKSTIKDLEAKLSKKEEKAVSSDDEIDDEDVGAHHVFPGVWQEPDEWGMIYSEMSEKLIQDLKDMLNKFNLSRESDAKEKFDEYLKDMLNKLNLSRESDAREKTDEERISQFRDLRDRICHLPPIDAQSEASTQYPHSRAATPFSPAFRDLRDRIRHLPPIDAQSEASTQYPHSRAATPFSPADSLFRKSFPSSQDLRSPLPNAPFNALFQQELQGEILSSDSVSAP